MRVTLLSDQWREIVFGSLLGDGSIAINKGYSNARFSFRHSVKQKDYFLWKVENLKEISGDKCVWMQENNGKDGFGGAKLRYQSLALPQLTEIHNLVTTKNHKAVRRKWLNLLTPRSLLVWWLDDGSLVADLRKGVFCTDSFSFEEVKIIQSYLRKVWDIKAKIVESRSRRDVIFFRLWLTEREELKKFLRLILPHLKVESMLYKVLILYKDSELQQRWISEVSELTGFSLATVNKHMVDRKSKLKKFRE